MRGQEPGTNVADRILKRKKYNNSPRSVIATIDALKLIEVLEDIAYDKSQSSKDRISAATRLLDKVLPNLQSVESVMLNANAELNLEDKTFLIQQLLNRKRLEGATEVISCEVVKEPLPVERSTNVVEEAKVEIVEDNEKIKVDAKRLKNKQKKMKQLSQENKSVVDDLLKGII